MATPSASAADLRAAARLADSAAMTLYQAASVDTLTDPHSVAAIARLNLVREHLIAAAHVLAPPFKYPRGTAVTAVCQTGWLLAGPFVLSAIAVSLVMADVGAVLTWRLINRRARTNPPATATPQGQTGDMTALFAAAATAVNDLEQRVSVALAHHNDDDQVAQQLHAAAHWLTLARQVVAAHAPSPPGQSTAEGPAPV
jgi:hypothetical protein